MLMLGLDCVWRSVGMGLGGLQSAMMEIRSVGMDVAVLVWFRPILSVALMKPMTAFS